jgi:F-type H+-transporting ATPase subunit b
MRTFALLLSLMLVPSAFALAQHDEHAGHDHAEGAAVEEGHEHADAGHHEGHPTLASVLGLTELQGAIVNFSILILILVVYGGRTVRTSLEARRDRVASELAEAKRLKEAAEATHALYTKRLVSLDAELETIREEMIKAGEAERDRLVAEAEKKAAGMRREGEFLIEQRMKQLKEDLTREAVAAAIAAAEKVLREKTTPEDQKRLSKAYLAGIGAVAKEGRV